MRYLLILLLAGCEALDFAEEPIDVKCRATCADCQEVVLECNGIGRGTVSQQKKVNRP